MSVVSTFDDFGSYYTDSATGRALLYTGPGYVFADTREPYADPSVPSVGYSSDYVRWGGYAGQPVEYKRPDGTWVSGGAPEHGESAGYLQRAFADPQVERLFKFAYEHPEALNNEQKAFMANPVLGLDSVGQGGRWGNLNLFDNQFNAQQAGGLMLTGGSTYLSDADKASGGQFIFDQSPAQQSARDDSGGFGDLLPVIVMLGIGIATGGFGLAGAGTMTGVEAGVMTAAEAAAAETAAMSAWAAAPAAGLTETVLTNAAIGAGASAIRGGNPLTGAITGGIGGLISGSGVLGDVSGGLIDATGATGAAANAITRGVNAAATGAISTAANGGSFEDVLEGGVISGITSGVSNYVAGSVLPSTNNTTAGGAGGAAGGLTQAVLTGGDIANGIITGGVAGAAGGLATDLGAGPGVAGAVGSIAGGLINSAVQQDPVVQPPTTTTVIPNGLSFSDVNPQFIHNPRADMQWGTRLSGA